MSFAIPGWTGTPEQLQMQREIDESFGKLKPKNSGNIYSGSFGSMWSICENCRFSDTCGNENYSKKQCDDFEFKRTSILKDEDISYSNPYLENVEMSDIS